MTTMTKTSSPIPNDAPDKEAQRANDYATLIAQGERAEDLDSLPDWSLRGMVNGSLPRPSGATPTIAPPGPASGGSSPPAGKREILVAPDLLRPLHEVYLSGMSPTKWWVEGLIPANAVTLLAGYAKDGKSTMMMSILTQATKGGKWCGMTVPLSTVWYMTEEGDATMYELLDDVGPPMKVTEAIPPEHNHGGEPAKVEALTNTKHMIGSISKWGGDWASLCQVLTQMVAMKPLEEQPAAIVIDTLGAWGNMEDTNDYAKIQKLLLPVRKLRDATGCAVIIVTHTRKDSGGDPLRSILGSAAFPGAVDHNIVITQDKDNPEQRHLQMRGRFRTAEDTVTIAYDGNGGFERIGETESPVLMCFDTRAWSAADIVATMKSRNWGKKRTRRELKRLVDAGDLEYTVPPPDPNAKLRRTQPTQTTPSATTPEGGQSDSSG